MSHVHDPLLVQNALIDITIDGKTYKGLRVLTAYQYHDGVNVEFYYPDGQYGYWKQSEDGGTYEVVGQGGEPNV